MPVPANIAALSTTAGSNSPPGSEAVTTVDDYLRAHASFIAQLRDQPSAFGLTLIDAVDEAAARATLGAGEPDPSGVMKQFAGASAPTGWLLCNGSAVSRTTYAALFAVVGSTYGAGDGSTTFNLPDTRNRVLIGAGTLYAIGATGGSKDAVVVSHTHTGTTDGVGNHSHVMQDGYITNAATGGGFASGGGLGAGSSTNPAGAHSHTFTTASSGVSGTNANLPPYLAVNMIIKT